MINEQAKSKIANREVRLKLHGKLRPFEESIFRYEINGLAAWWLCYIHMPILTIDPLEAVDKLVDAFSDWWSIFIEYNGTYKSIKELVKDLLKDSFLSSKHLLCCTFTVDLDDVVFPEEVTQMRSFNEIERMVYHVSLKRIKENSVRYYRDGEDTVFVLTPEASKYINELEGKLNNL